MQGSAGTGAAARAAAAAAREQQRHPALQGRYELVRRKGEGGFAQVWEARHRRTGQEVAVKIIDLARMVAAGMPVRKVEREVAVMRLLRHPHVVRIYEAFATAEHAYIVMEFAKGGELHDHVVIHGKLREGEARVIFQQIIAGIAYCHHNMVVHRDIKMENILLDSNNDVKIADFGFSKFFRHNKFLSAPCGTLQYAAPELHAGRAYIGPQVDVWSCGVVLFILLCGSFPFDGMGDDTQVTRNIRSGMYTIPPYVSDDARDLISSMLILKPEQRMTITEVRTHRWSQCSIPSYLATLPLDAHRQIIKFDGETVNQVVRHGLDRRCVVESLRNGRENEETVTYNLILSEKFDARTIYLSTVDEYRRLEEANTTAVTLNRRHQPAAIHSRAGTGAGGADAGHIWELCGVDLHGCARDAWRRIAAALPEMGVVYVYDALGHARYGKMVCARAPGTVPGGAVRCIVRTFLAVAAASSSAAGDNSTVNGGAFEVDDDMLEGLSAAVFFEIQLYKSSGEGNYVMKLKRIFGSQLEYISICSELGSKLRASN